jgi:anaerobic ribonucleoside-triphosphate reductase
MTNSPHVFDGFRKRDGSIVPFRRGKIETAILRAAEAVSRAEETAVDASLPGRVTDIVLHQLGDPSSAYFVVPDDQSRRIPNIEDVQDVVEIVLSDEKCSSIVAAYKRYRKQRELARERIRVRDAKRGVTDVTDASLLLVESATSNVTLPWDRKRIATQLIDRVGLPVETATSVAKAVENHIIATGVKTIGTTLIRELVNNELAVRGLSEQLRDLSVYGVSRDFVEQLMFTKPTENSNIVNNNPEAVNLGIAELILKQWALDTIFSPTVKRAHDTGEVHLHDLGYPHRVYCSSHSIEYVKKYGLKNLSNLNTESSPARSASVLTAHLNTFLASMQANYAGALGIAYINILYAPYLQGMDAAQLKQVAQELIFNGSQNAFSRGGQTLFLDFNVHTGVPKYLMSVPAIGPGGRYMLRSDDGAVHNLDEVTRSERDAKGNPLMELYLTDPTTGDRRCVLREVPDAVHGAAFDPLVEKELEVRGEAVVRYGDFQREAREFTKALLQVWKNGDRNGRIFEFPKCDFHVSEESFTDPEQFEIFMQACELASANGSTYFIFDRDEVTLSACCRLRTTIQDSYMLRHPESMRFCGFQNITINIPQAAYRASRAGHRNLQGLFAELDKTMELAAQAHIEKKGKIAIMMKEGGPLFQIGRTANDGRPYVDLNSCTYIIGLIGVNDTVKFLTGKEFEESPEALETGLRITAHMQLKAKQLTAKHGLKFSLEESPAESAARRLAKTDLIYFHDEAKGTIKGDNEDVAYYTNSVHLKADADVSLIERIRCQSLFHAMIESGAIIHAFVGEERPSPGSIARLVRQTFLRTQAAQLTISPEFTYCEDCNHIMRGLIETCTSCRSTRVVGETRVVGYFSKVHNWNRSKRYGELPARHRGMYTVEAVPEAPANAEAPVFAAK